MTFMQHYARDLRRMDWGFEFSDENPVYQRGREELARLRKIQRELDPGAVIWNQYAPDTYKVDQS